MQWTPGAAAVGRRLRAPAPRPSNPSSHPPTASHLPCPICSPCPQVYRGARKGRGLVVSPKDYSTKYRWVPRRRSQRPRTARCICFR